MLIFMKDMLIKKDLYNVIVQKIPIKRVNYISQNFGCKKYARRYKKISNSFYLLLNARITCYYNATKLLALNFLMHNLSGSFEILNKCIS